MLQVKQMRAMTVIHGLWCQICSRLILCFGHNLWVFPFSEPSEILASCTLWLVISRGNSFLKICCEFFGGGNRFLLILQPQNLAESVTKWCFEWRHEWMGWCNLPFSLPIWENGLNTFCLCDFTMNNGGVWWGY